MEMPAPRAVNPLASVRVTSPEADAAWVAGELSTVRWTNAAGITGGIYLADAATGAAVGWISAGTGTDQTSYQWDTRFVSASRTDPSRKEVGVGRYVVVLRFDRKPPIEVKSAPFSIIYPVQVQAKVLVVALKGFSAVPAAAMVEKGTVVRFVNSDAVAHTLADSGGGAYTLAPGESKAIDTKFLGAGTHIYSSFAYPSLVFRLTVK
jgi:plastocyanin